MSAKKVLVPNYDLKWLREYANYSQQQCSDLLKVNRVTYANWERGETVTPKNALSMLAAKLGCDIDIIPKDLKEAAQQEVDAVAFAAEVQSMMKTPSSLVIEAMTFNSDMEGTLPSLPKIDIPLHMFRPSSMKYYNVPVERWSEYVKDKKGEDSAALRAAGYSWDQAVEWRTTEARAQAYALLMLWGQARDKHFEDRASESKRKKIGMPQMQYAEVVRIFDELCDLQGWGMV
jgi:transcriptional regulator with XRE-family HTH domain